MEFGGGLGNSSVDSVYLLLLFVVLLQQQSRPREELGCDFIGSLTSKGERDREMGREREREGEDP